MSDMPDPFVQEPTETAASPRRHRLPSLFWPLLLIGGGVIMLLQTLGLASWDLWAVLLKFWPVLLILIGIEVIFGRRSTAGSIASTILVLLIVAAVALVLLAGPSILGLAGLDQSEEWRQQEISHPRDEIKEARVYIDWSSPPGSLGALRDSGNLIEGSIDYRGEIVFEVGRHNDRVEVELDSHSSGSWTWLPSSSSDLRWEVWLSPDVLFDLSLDAGSGSCTFDLSDLRIADLFIDGGSGAIELILPAGRDFEAEIDGGSGSLDIVLPKNVGARVELDSGSGSFLPDSRFSLVSGERYDDGVWETDNYGQAEVSILFRIDQGSGSIRIER